MLDSVVLTLDRRHFEVLLPERFNPSAKGLLAPPFYSLGSRGIFTCVQNPAKSDVQAGRYLPKLTLIKRKIAAGFCLTLRIEFSAPKLVFANNFDELETEDFPSVLALLYQSLTGTGIQVARDALRTAPISAIHYSKNIAFTDYTTCSMVLSDLKRIDLTKRLDVSHTDYRNEGEAIRCHANNFEVIFYDKLKEMAQAQHSKKRAIERDYGVQGEMLWLLASLPKELEVLRMEVRLGTRRKIKSVLQQLGMDMQPTFETMFDAGIARAALGHFWNDVRTQLPLIGAASERPEKILDALATGRGGKIRPGTLLQQLGCTVLVGSVGVRGAGAALSRYCSRRSWQRYKLELKTLSLAKVAGYTGLNQVDEALARFEPLRLKTFQVSATERSVARGDV